MMEMSAELTAAVLENILRHGKFNIPTKNAMENAVRILRENACLLKEKEAEIERRKKPTAGDNKIPLKW